MGNSLHGAAYLSLAFSLLMPSALSAQAVDAEQPPYYYKATPRVGGNPLRGRESPGGSPRDDMPAVPTVPPEGLKAMPPVPPSFPRVDLQPYRLVEQPRFEPPDLGWVRYVMYAAFALLGGWGVSQRLPSRSSPPDASPGACARPRSAPPPRQEQLGLGADGRGGVWLREVPPWEDEQAPGSD
jgi:hypothetical protein